MKLWKTIVFALIPVTMLLLTGEIFCRQLIGNDSLRILLLGSPVISGIDIHLFRDALYRLGGQIYQLDPYNGYRLKESPDPASRRPPRLPGEPKAPDEVRVLCIGDSVAYGLLLSEEEAWSGCLQTYVRQWMPPDTRIEVYNGGVPGYGPQQCKRLLQSRLIQLEPDIILWHEEPWTDDQLELPQIISERQMRLRAFFFRFRLFFFLTFLRDLIQGDQDAGWHLFNLPQQRISKEASLASFNSLILWCRERGVKAFIGVEYLTLQQSQIEGDQINGNGDDWRNQYLDYVPSLEAFRTHPAGLDTLFIDVCHLSEKGSDYLGWLVSEYLRKRWPEVTPIKMGNTG